MNFLMSVINESETRTRGRWLLSCLFFFILCPFAVSIVVLSLSIWIQVPEDVIIASLSQASIGLISILSLWYFAYKKWGTKVLTCGLVLSPGKYLTSIIECLMGPHSSWIVMYIAIDCIVFLWWYVMSFKVRRVNKAIRARKRELGFS